MREKNRSLLRFLGSALAIDPEYTFARANKGYSLNELGRYVEAIACFDQILELSANNIRAMTAKGIALRELGKNEEALACFDKAIGLNPINSFVWYNKAIALRNLGRSKEADAAIRIVNYPQGTGKN